MLNFNFLEKCLGIVSSPNFVHDFSRKMLPCYILLTDQISFSDCLYLLRARLEHFYMRPEVNSNRFEISNHFEMSFCLWQFTWRFHCGNFPSNSKTLLHMCK